MNRLREIYRELEEIAQRESVRLFRLSRKAAEHGCSDRLCCQIRMEAWDLYRINPEQLLNPFASWKFAFFGGGYNA